MFKERKEHYNYATHVTSHKVKKEKINSLLLVSNTRNSSVRFCFNSPVSAARHQGQNTEDGRCYKNRSRDAANRRLKGKDKERCRPPVTKFTAKY